MQSQLEINETLTVRETAALMGVTAMHVRRLIRKGRLQTTSNGGPPVVERSAIELYQKSLGDNGGHKSAIEAAAMLGVTRWTVVKMIHRGLMKAGYISSKNGGRAWCIAPEEIERVRELRQGKRRLVQPKLLEEDWLGNKDVAKLIGRSAATACRIMSDGTLEGAVKRNGGWKVQRPVVEKYLAKRVPQRCAQAAAQAERPATLGRPRRCDPMTLVSDRKARLKAQKRWTEKTILKSWLTGDLWDRITSCSQDPMLISEIALAFDAKPDDLNPTLCFVLAPGNGQRFAAMMPGADEHTNLKRTSIVEIKDVKRTLPV